MASSRPSSSAFRAYVVDEYYGLGLLKDGRRPDTPRFTPKDLDVEEYRVGPTAPARERPLPPHLIKEKFQGKSPTASNWSPCAALRRCCCCHQAPEMHSRDEGREAAGVLRLR